VKTGDKIFGYRNRQPEVTPIESPTGVDLHPHPEDPVRVSKRAGLAILTIVILLLIAFAYGGYRRTQKCSGVFA
jgi:hypothetical protein